MLEQRVDVKLMHIISNRKYIPTIIYNFFNKNVGTSGICTENVQN